MSIVFTPKPTNGDALIDGYSQFLRNKLLRAQQMEKLASVTDDVTRRAVLLRRANELSNRALAGIRKLPRLNADATRGQAIQYRCYGTAPRIVRI